MQEPLSELSRLKDDPTRSEATRRMAGVCLELWFRTLSANDDGRGAPRLAEVSRLMLRLRNAMQVAEGFELTTARQQDPDRTAP
ncbi:hypothetical protein [Phenylobacterium sp. J367]|uniref:hypothetical protein n=1 Tax=Phenylobacterium sp. J367 TaxID=2898435 RepID=UPI0021508212|nr:hypothetical protein [Phenylobacterium sp. J367]MCR5879673.1 hypothetical protein [Phenylobacterium sp. J367]